MHTCTIVSKSFPKRMMPPWGGWDKVGKGSLSFLWTFKVIVCDFYSPINDLKIGVIVCAVVVMQGPGDKINCLDTWIRAWIHMLDSYYRGFESSIVISLESSVNEILVKCISLNSIQWFIDNNVDIPKYQDMLSNVWNKGSNQIVVDNCMFIAKMGMNLIFAEDTIRNVCIRFCNAFENSFFNLFSGIIEFKFRDIPIFFLQPILSYFLETSMNGQMIINNEGSYHEILRRSLRKSQITRLIDENFHSISVFLMS